MASEQEIWPLDRCFQTVDTVSAENHPVAYTLLTGCFRNPDVWADIVFPNNAVAEELKSYIGKRLTPQPTKVRAKVEVTCFAYEGIDAIKTALRTAETKNTEDTQVKVRLISSPLYVLNCTCLEKNVGIQRLQEAIEDIRGSIEKTGGKLVVQMEPRAVTESDDAELQALMEKTERENAEVSSDASDGDFVIPEV
jgi:translation initiation factor 2 subunit 1